MEEETPSRELQLSDVTYSKVMEVAQQTVYGEFKIWHLVAFLVIGPMLTWPMLVVLLLVVFNNQTINLFKGVRSSTSNNG